MASQACQATSEDAEELGDAILVTPNDLACVCAGGRLLCWRGKKKKDFEPFAASHRFSSPAFGSSNSVQSPLDLNREGMWVLHAYEVCSVELDPCPWFWCVLWDSLYFLLQKLSLARDFTLIPHKTEGDLLQPEFNVYIITPEENLHLVNADEFWHPPANAFLSFLIPDTLLVLVNSCSPRCIILWYVRGLLNSGFCSDAVLCSWACGVVCGWNWKGKQLIWDWALILDVLLPSDKQYEWDIFKEHESVQVRAQERREQLCPSKFPLLQRAFGRCAFWAGGWHSAWGWRKGSGNNPVEDFCVKSEGKTDGQV